jgi:hypothetical protein
MITSFKIFEEFSHDFKVGDIVICIENDNTILKKGSEYKVLRLSGANIFVQENPKEKIQVWNKRRFIHANDWNLYNNITKYNL